MKKRQRIALFILLFGTMLIFGMIENIKGVAYPLIREEFNTSWERHGLMVSVFSIAYVGFCIIGGIFLGRFGIKASLLCGFAILLLGLVSVFFAPGFLLTAAALFFIFASLGFFEIGINALASRLFLAKAALMMSVLHSFYGIGSMIGPKAAGLIADNTSFGWRPAYLFAVPFVLALFIPALRARFPQEGADAAADGESASAGRKSFFDALRSPLMWLMAICLGLSVSVELSSSNWGPMYFQDMYGINPNTGGATFLSSFFLLFTVSRLACGPLIERIGYVRTLLGLAVIVIAVFIAGFSLGETGIFVLPALGFFTALFWPTILATAIVSFGKDAPVCTSAMIGIAGLINAAVQFLTGFTNQIFGPAWGYRSSIAYTLLLAAALLVLNRRLKAAS